MTMPSYQVIADDIRDRDRFVSDGIHVWTAIGDARRGQVRDNQGGSPPTLSDENPASVVGVPWNEDGYAGGSKISRDDCLAKRASKGNEDVVTVPIQWARDLGLDVRVFTPGTPVRIERDNA